MEKKLFKVYYLPKIYDEFTEDIHKLPIKLVDKIKELSPLAQPSCNLRKTHLPDTYCLAIMLQHDTIESIKNVELIKNLEGVVDVKQDFQYDLDSSEDPHEGLSWDTPGFEAP